MTFSGNVSALMGRCPAISFTAGATAITADASTKFQGGKCGDVKNGRAVSGNGTTTADGTVRASLINLKDATH